MKEQIIVNLKCPCFLFRYPNLDIQSQALFIGQVPSLLDAIVKTTKVSKALQATRGSPSDSAGTVWSQFGTVKCVLVGRLPLYPRTICWCHSE